MRTLRTFLLTLCLTTPAIAAGTPDRPTKQDGLQLIREFTVNAFNQRLGPDYAFYHKAPEKLPEIWMAPAKQDPGGRQYQIGGPWKKEAGDYSSTQGQVWFVPDPGAFPVDRVTILEWAHGAFTEAPLPPWHGGFRPEPASKTWLSAAPPAGIGVPVGMARGMATMHWSNCGVIAFSSGLVSAAGTVTARGTEPVLQLPPGKIPTAVSVTNKNEFALITVHDANTGKGQLAVIAIETAAKDKGFVHDWHDDKPWSLPNVAFITNLKLLGFVDLPGIDVPTSVCAVGNREGGRLSGRDGHAGQLREYDLSKAADRKVFLPGGGNGHYFSTAGFAVVAGKYENKAAFVDLQPLFDGVREMYLTTDANYAKTRDAGLAPEQWPYAFSHAPKWKPPVVKTIDVLQPTAVIASMSGDAKARAMIASMDGTLAFYTVGGLATDAAANPAEIFRVDAVQLGRNPVCLAYQKFRTDSIMSVSRGDRKIEWVQYAPQGIKVTRTLRDARLLDPVHVEQADTHGIETQLITVTDFKGKKIVNYRCSPVKFATQGGASFGLGPDGKSDFECGGALELPGHPLGVSASNVN